MNEQIKLEAQNFCNEAEKFSRGEFNQKEDVIRITELALANHDWDYLDSLSFNAKYTQGLLKIIRNRANNIEDEYFEKIKVEYSEKIQKFKSELQELTNKAGKFVESIFDEKYYALTPQALENLNKLCSDLGKVKSYLNEKKHGGI